MDDGAAEKTDVISTHQTWHNVGHLYSTCVSLTCMVGVLHCVLTLDYLQEKHKKVCGKCLNNQKEMNHFRMGVDVASGFPLSLLSGTDPWDNGSSHQEKRS